MSWPGRRRINPTFFENCPFVQIGRIVRCDPVRVPGNEIRHALLKLFGRAAACLYLNKTEAPKRLIDAFESSISPIGMPSPFSIWVATGSTIRGLQHRLSGGS